MSDTPAKPLGRKAYGSIGHVHGSRLGPGDHHVHEGQSAMCTTKAPRDKTVWVQTKLDGSCVAAALLDDGQLVALGRAGYLAETSTYEMHHMWARWVRANEDRFRQVLNPGERLVGEWLAQAHGTLYDLTHREPFVAFDVMTGDKRLTVADFYEGMIIDRDGSYVFQCPDVLLGPMTPEKAMEQLHSYGADQPEGVVYRVEGRKGVDFLAKWVRPDKTDGKYLMGDEPVWNWTEP
jgi:hypothetical protein